MASSLRGDKVMASSAIGELRRHRCTLAPHPLARCATTLAQRGRWLQVTVTE